MLHACLRSAHEHFGISSIYMCHMMGILISGTYMALTCEVDIADGCVWHMHLKVLNQYYAHLV